MEESSTYQYIVEKGRVDEARRILFRIGAKRFGEPDAAARLTIDAIDSSERLEQMVERATEAASWRELLQ